MLKKKKEIRSQNIHKDCINQILESFKDIFLKLNLSKIKFPLQIFCKSQYPMILWHEILFKICPNSIKNILDKDLKTYGQIYEIPVKDQFCPTLEEGLTPRAEFRNLKTDFVEIKCVCVCV
ncbi:hypothetical protein Dimus_039644 [Dionaea muscipula]